jgi:hypothetical protein
MGPTALLLLRRKASAGCEPVNLGTKDQDATFIPPKPLRMNFTLAFDLEDLSNYRPVDIRTVRLLETWAAHFAVTLSRNGILSYTAVESWKSFRGEFFWLRRKLYNNCSINLKEPCVLYIGRAYRYPPNVGFYIFF